MGIFMGELLVSRRVFPPGKRKMLFFLFCFFFSKEKVKSIGRFFFPKIRKGKKQVFGIPTNKRCNGETSRVKGYVLRCSSRFWGMLFRALIFTRFFLEGAICSVFCVRKQQGLQLFDVYGVYIHNHVYRYIV